MANLLGIDIKKMRSSKMGRLLPDSELIRKMYHQFHISPAFILRDPKELLQELNYVLELLGEDSRKVTLRILKDGYDLVWARTN